MHLVYDGAGIDTANGLVMGAHWGHLTHHSTRDKAAWRVFHLQILATDLVHFYRVSRVLALMSR